MTIKHIILASKSSVRKNLLSNSGIEFEVISSDYDEKKLQDKYFNKNCSIDDVKYLTEELSFQKALDVSKIHNDSLIIGCDQILYFNNKIMLKPKNIEEAKEQLRQLRGNTHKLITTTLCVLNKKKVWSHISEQNMKMRIFGDNYIDGYISRMENNILSIVGGYEIEGLGINLFDEIGDDIFSIQGISILHLLGYLREMEYIT
jgi:septum formation protein